WFIGLSITDLWESRTPASHSCGNPGQETSSFARLTIRAVQSPSNYACERPQRGNSEISQRMTKHATRFDARCWPPDALFHRALLDPAFVKGRPESRHHLESFDEPFVADFHVVIFVKSGAPDCLVSFRERNRAVQIPTTYRAIALYVDRRVSYVMHRKREL